MTLPIKLYTSIPGNTFHMLGCGAVLCCCELCALSMNGIFHSHFNHLYTATRTRTRHQTNIKWHNYKIPNEVFFFKLNVNLPLIYYYYCHGLILFFFVFFLFVLQIFLTAFDMDLHMVAFISHSK